MTPEQYARKLAESSNRDDVVEGIGMIFRGLTDPDPSDPYKMPWPKTIEVARRAAQHLGLRDPGHDLLADVVERAPSIPDYLLNR